MCTARSSIHCISALMHLIAWNHCCQHVPLIKIRIPRPFFSWDYQIALQSFHACKQMILNLLNVGTKILMWFDITSIVSS